MTETPKQTDERRATLLFRHSEFVVQTEEQFMEVARAIRASDEAAEMVLVPRAHLQSIYDDHMAGQSGIPSPHATHLSLHALATLIAMIAASQEKPE